ncbi:Aminopeptidase M1 [Camellia lanceoleosa]|uniref:Aminopeptidase M1 n=1 Tax=Camellia lanceoleosa TaxID=1840588 RepID=A0ACC0GB06_9ERIC|nr:Aminopeptidase M1 [Camellia lanceoleosa]
MWINHWNGSRSLHLHLQLAIVVTHEVAHQWFGNLVTMEWWTHLWLNEGFATWVSYLVTDTLFPEWEIWTKFLEDTAGGLHLDALETSHPVEVEIHYARSIDEVADDI